MAHLEVVAAAVVVEEEEVEEVLPWVVWAVLEGYLLVECQS